MLKRISFIASLVIIFIVVFVCMFKINLINTKNLSVEKYDSKYIDMMDEASKEEYLSFIRDDSYIKIYDEDIGYKVKLGQNRFFLRKNSKIINYVKKIFDKKKDFNIKEFTDADRVLKEYEKLSKEDKRNFDIGLAALKSETLEPYSNPVTTEDQLSELQDILVQVCINYININGLTDIDEIAFNADSLQRSAHFGKWVPATDSYIRAVGYEETNDEKNNYCVRKKIGDIW